MSIPRPALQRTTTTRDLPQRPPLRSTDVTSGDSSAPSSTGNSTTATATTSAVSLRQTAPQMTVPNRSANGTEATLQPAPSLAASTQGRAEGRSRADSALPSATSPRRTLRKARTLNEEKSVGKEAAPSSPPREVKKEKPDPPIAMPAEEKEAPPPRRKTSFLSLTGLPLMGMGGEKEKSSVSPRSPNATTSTTLSSASSGAQVRVPGPLAMPVSAPKGEDDPYHRDDLKERLEVSRGRLRLAELDSIRHTLGSRQPLELFRDPARMPMRWMHEFRLALAPIVSDFHRALNAVDLCTDRAEEAFDSAFDVLLKSLSADVPRKAVLMLAELKFMTREGVRDADPEPLIRQLNSDLLLQSLMHGVAAERQPLARVACECAALHFGTSPLNPDLDRYGRQFVRAKDRKPSADRPTFLMRLESLVNATPPQQIRQVRQFSTDDRDFKRRLEEQLRQRFVLMDMYRGDEGQPSDCATPEQAEAHKKWRAAPLYPAFRRDVQLPETSAWKFYKGHDAKPADTVDALLPLILGSGRQGDFTQMLCGQKTMHVIEALAGADERVFEGADGRKLGVKLQPAIKWHRIHDLEDGRRKVEVGFIALADKAIGEKEAVAQRKDRATLQEASPEELKLALMGWVEVEMSCMLHANGGLDERSFQLSLTGHNLHELEGATEALPSPKDRPADGARKSRVRGLERFTQFASSSQSSTSPASPASNSPTSPRSPRGSQRGDSEALRSSPDKEKKSSPEKTEQV